MRKLITTIIPALTSILSGCSFVFYEPPINGEIAELQISNYTDAAVDAYTYRDSSECRGTLAIPTRQVTTLWGSPSWTWSILGKDSASIKVPANKKFTTTLVLIYPYQRCNITSTFTPLPQQKYELHISENVYSCRIYLTQVMGNKKIPAELHNRIEKNIFFENDPACE